MCAKQVIESDELEVPLEVNVEQVKKEPAKDSTKEREEQRHKSTPWRWLVAALVLSVMVAGGVLVAQSSMKNALQGVGQEAGGESEQGVESGESESSEQNSGDEGSESPEEEPEPESEKPIEEKPAEEKPVEEKPVVMPPKEEPLQPIAPRPEQPQDYQGSKGKKLIALTFDDGPSAYTTPRLLDTLKNRGAKVTFFVLGTMARRSPDIVRREAAEGHEVASHTPYHNQLTLLSAAQVRAEALEMDRTFTEILGTRPPFTRPPYGSFNAMVGEALGQPMILWSVDPQDWKDRNASLVCSRVVNATREGSIILVHDIHATTVDAVPCIIDTLRSYGYEFVTVSELAASRGVKLVNGRAYYSF